MIKHIYFKCLVHNFISIVYVNNCINNFVFFCLNGENIYEHNLKYTEFLAFFMRLSYTLI